MAQSQSDLRRCSRTASTRAVQQCPSCPPISPADPFHAARELHRRVKPEFWCITREDLVVFERDVRAAWRDGKIPDNPEKPNRYHNDPKIGPTIYAVNEHWLKPKTAEAGGMSYALMLHPQVSARVSVHALVRNVHVHVCTHFQGLKCDVFVTHAWSEGVFEFLGKVLRTWPK